MFEVACRCHLLAVSSYSLRFLFGFYWPRPCPSGLDPATRRGACCREFAMYDHGGPEAGRDISVGSHFMLRTHIIAVCEPLKSTLYLCTLQILFATISEALKFQTEKKGPTQPTSSD